ncbi:C13 family peptidase [uncultured Treponema sp.]|uniref:C13 family peptidase n=1 Tax=uncultured Treponema sp. TaxID=162155 RepID=UPI0025E88B7F|nr:C13 family peptidase [uncultured Treponema sp.]
MKKINKNYRFVPVSAKNILLILFYVLFLCLASCSDDSDSSSSGKTSDTDSWRKIKVAMVLPSSGEQSSRFHRIADWYLSSLKTALTDSEFSTPFILDLEWYSEESENLASMAESLSKRDDVFAIIGPRYSDHVQVFAEPCFINKKPLIAPCAASESIIRAFAMNAASAAHSDPFLWALTETDISQTEALLAKVAAYGGKKVAFISSADLYGETFFNWGPYIASELKLTPVNNIRYISSENAETSYGAGTQALPLASAASEALGSGADYVLCALSSYKDAQAILQERERLGDSSPRLLFTDTAFTADFLKEEFAGLAEGVEGTAPYADPTSGFVVMYEARFNEKPSVGEANLYDALLLCGFAAARCIKNEATTPISNHAVNEAIKSFTGTGSGGKSALSPLGMMFAFEDIDANKTVNINGATGLLDFDAETLTSALRTVYTHWTVAEGSFEPLDYTSSDGNGRTAGNRASWEWGVLIDEIEKQLQEESEGVSVDYEEAKSHWAVIVAASNGWQNYRHQADALYLYQLLKKKTKIYNDDNIILILADDIAGSKRNKKPGEIYARLNGENLYTDDIQIDYLLSELTADDMVNIMKGEAVSIESRSEDRQTHPRLVESPTQLNSDGQSDILWFWSGHGANRNGNGALGQFVWQGKGKEGFTTERMKATLDYLSGQSESNQNQKCYRKMLIIAEPCYSASVLNVAQNDAYKGILAFTAANGYETSFADLYSVELKVWLSNRFTHNFTDKMIETINSADQNGSYGIFYADLYKYLVQNTIGSHVQLFNAGNFGNLYATWPIEFFN